LRIAQQIAQDSSEAFGIDECVDRRFGQHQLQVLAARLEQWLENRLRQGPFSWSLWTQYYIAQA